MGDDDGAKLEDVQRALGALVFDAGVERLLAADDDDLPMSQLRARMLAEPLRPPPPSQAQLFGEQMVTILRDGLRQQLIDGASGKLGQHRAPRTGLAQNGERVVRSLVYTTIGYSCLVSTTEMKTPVRSMEQLMELLGAQLMDLARVKYGC